MAPHSLIPLPDGQDDPAGYTVFRFDPRQHGRVFLHQRSPARHKGVELAVSEVAAWGTELGLKVDLGRRALAARPDQPRQGGVGCQTFQFPVESCLGDALLARAAGATSEDRNCRNWASYWPALAGSKVTARQLRVARTSFGKRQITSGSRITTGLGSLTCSGSSSDRA